MLHALFERVGDSEAQFTLEVRRSNAGRDRALRAPRLQGRRASAAATTPTTARTRSSCGARRRRGAARSTTSPPATVRPDEPRRAILALETSCDDTCAAVVTRDGEIRSNVVSSQGIHDRYGGVVPEIASRHHLELVNAVVDDALARARRHARRRRARSRSPRGPGLVGALLVGVATAKGLAAARRLPLAPVDHLQGHVAANYLAPDPIEPPFLCLIASGGHTLLARVTEHGALRAARQTLDDAAGEAFDKGARLLGLGYPGGPALSKLARAGRPDGLRVPDRRRASPGLDFSLRRAEDRAALHGPRPRPGGDRAPRRRPRRLLRARDRRGADRRASSARSSASPAPALAIGGGVAANRLLRERAAAARRARPRSRRPSCAPTTPR